MKLKIKELLEAKFGTLETDQLERVTTQVLKSAKTEEEAETFIDDLTVSSVLQSYADSRVNEAVKKLKAKGSKDDPTTEATKKGATTTEEEQGEPIETQSHDKESNKLLQLIIERLDRLETKDLKTTRSEQIGNLIKDLPESLQRGYRRMDITSPDEDEFSELLKQVQEEVTEIGNDLRKSGATFGTPKSKGVDSTGGGEPKAPTKEELEAVVGLID